MIAPSFLSGYAESSEFNARLFKRDLNLKNRKLLGFSESEGQDMAADEQEFWNDIWSGSGDAVPKADRVLIEKTQDLPHGRALDIGCGAGGNAVWLAGQGWKVTAADISEVAIELGESLARSNAVEVDFVVADATNYKPQGEFDLITMFYLHLPPDDRAKLLAVASNALADGGTLIFVGHDQSGPPSGASEERLLMLTNPTDVAGELNGLTIEEAVVLDDDTDGVRGSHMSHMKGGRSHDHELDEGHRHGEGPNRTTLVRAVKT
jgi:SAM-dependent methyltransferase